MTRAAQFALLFLLAAGAAQAQPALTNKATDLQAQAQSDSAVVAGLPENTRVEVLARKGAWSQVRTAAGQNGWVRMLNLKPEGTGTAQQGSSPLGAINNLLSAGRSTNAATVTTGVRGLSEEDLQRAQADFTELEKVQRLRADRAAAHDFARRSKLTPTNVDELNDPARSVGQNQVGG
ncbi:SH3 domain-containing protein [Noviherbaspirillum sp. CPCC 100848]|uniref:SH3 domain-containing protein n=1 Tax=Noviherbaspirillum album TaxID=3080276 RepID=A0ABU6J722_9BURK|nr:SH3 domain-containing protein [Noviherbaspirillum sp. CPCC 100848]MEC4719323.1 SH3 domain-containing protein [Noviherbaspirillum sp. CPCC 100848]